MSLVGVCWAFQRVVFVVNIVFYLLDVGLCVNSMEGREWLCEGDRGYGSGSSLKMGGGGEVIKKSWEIIKRVDVVSFETMVIGEFVCPIVW